MTMLLFIVSGHARGG